MAFLLVLLCLCACNEDKAQSQTSTGLDRLIVTTESGQQKFIVELAITPDQMQAGLMNREHMAENAGMLFYFGAEDERGFYMKNTLIPLDMIFIRQNGQILSIHENAVPLDETTIYSKGPAAGVLEINGGLAEKLGIRPGDTVHHTFFNNELGE